MPTPSFQEINNHLESKKKLSLNSIFEFLTDKFSRPLKYESEKERPEKYRIRMADLDRETYDKLLRPIVFGEVSNRDTDKKELESRIVLNTAINRLVEKKRMGHEMSFGEVLSEPKQYQAYGGEQFNLYHSQDLDEPTKQKKQEIDSILNNLWNEVKSGTFEDNTQGAYYYIHNKDGTITYDNNKKLFAD